MEAIAVGVVSARQVLRAGDVHIAQYQIVGRQLDAADQVCRVGIGVFVNFNLVACAHVLGQGHPEGGTCVGDDVVVCKQAVVLSGCQVHRQRQLRRMVNRQSEHIADAAGVARHIGLQGSDVVLAIGHAPASDGGAECSGVVDRVASDDVQFFAGVQGGVAVAVVEQSDGGADFTLAVEHIGIAQIAVGDAIAQCAAVDGFVEAQLGGGRNCLVDGECQCCRCGAGVAGCIDGHGGDVVIAVAEGRC